MKIERLEEKVALPDGVTATYDTAARALAVNGPKGELKRVIFHPALSVTVEGDTLIFVAKDATLREKKLLYTARAHAKNLIRGVTEGYTYTLKVCSGHFPMTVASKNGVFEIKNFLGEKVPRTLKLKEGADVTIEGDKVIVTGIDKEIVGQVAADIEQLSKRPGFDSRIFQDGIFIINKAGKQI